MEVHELLRQYAQERLKDNPQACLSAQEAHAAYYAEFMEQRWQQLKGKRQMLALTEIEADIENVRASWRYYLSQNNVPQLWKFIKGLWYIYWIRWWNHAGMELFAEAVGVLRGEEDEDSAALRALAMSFQAYFMGWLGLSKQGYELVEESLAILQQLNHPEALVFAYDSLIVNIFFQNRNTEQIEATQEMLTIANEVNDKWLLAFTLFPSGLAAVIIEDYTEARRVAKSHLSLCEEIGDVIGSTLPLIVLGHAALALGEYEQARGIYHRCKKISQMTGFLYAFQTSSKYLGKVNLSMGKIAEAEQNLHQCLTMTVEIGFVRDIINLFYEFARLRVAQDNSEQAVELLAFVVQHPVSNESRLLEGRIRDSAKNLLAEIEVELPQETYTAALEIGKEMELDEIIADLVGPKRK